MEASLLSFGTSMSETAKKSSKGGGRSKSRWSAAITRHSNALDLTPKIFRSTNPRRIAMSLKRSAQASKRRKGTPYQSAMSMLNFYINRAGKSLPKKQKDVLERAKDELRDAFGRS
jgi:putative cell wall-binding protein